MLLIANAQRTAARNAVYRRAGYAIIAQDVNVWRIEVRVIRAPMIVSADAIVRHQTDNRWSNCW